MNEEWFRQMLIDAHNNQRTHMKRIIDGLSEDFMRKEISQGEDFTSIMKLVWHVASAETFWFHKGNHSIGNRIDDSDTQTVLKKIDENTDRIAEVISTCSVEQLRIVPPSPEGGPSVAWALLRTYMHGIYHTGQIAKIRRMIGAPELPFEGVSSWDLAVDSVANLIHGFLHDSIQF
ncbi:MAG: DinB family protein [Candidatus Thorarchaeota archaeon]|nr:DinB family protein [Candidatus Thorarchaeota archaeon]